MNATLTRAGDTAPGWLDAWTDALRELELGLEETTRLLTVGATGGPVRAWVPPTQLGRLPASLRERAEALLARQLDVARSLAEAAEHSRRHLQILDQLRSVPEAVPVYLDTAG